MLSFIFSNDLLVSLLFGFCIFMVIYLNLEKIMQFLYNKSFGTEQEVLSIMNKMLIETNPKKVTTLVWLVSVGLGAVFFLILWPNFIVGFIVGAAFALIGWAVPKRVLNSLWESRCDKIVTQLVDGLTIMSNSVRSGLTVAQALQRVNENMKGPLTQEFSLILNKIKLGMSVENAFNEFSERIARDDIQMLTTAINILKETGGNMADTFDTITFTIRERQKIHKKIEAMTTSSITQGMIITLAPFALLIFYALTDPDYIKPLFTTFVGWFFLVIIFGLQIMGALMMKKIVTIKV